MKLFNLTTQQILIIGKSLFFLLIPFILIWVEGQQLPSISEYYHYQGALFGLLLGSVALLFFDTGFNNRNRWFEMTIGASMIGVVLFNNHDYHVLHYGFAGYFFLGCIFNMICFSSGRYRALMISIGVFILLSMVGGIILDWYSTLWMEFIGMVPISIHKILETIGKID